MREPGWMAGPSRLIRMYASVALQHLGDLRRRRRQLKLDVPEARSPTRASVSSSCACRKDAALLAPMRCAIAVGIVEGDGEVDVAVSAGRDGEVVLQRARGVAERIGDLRVRRQPVLRRGTR